MIERRLDVDLRPEISFPFSLYSETCDTSANSVEMKVPTGYPSTVHNSMTPDNHDRSKFDDELSTTTNCDLNIWNMRCNAAIDSNTCLCSSHEPQSTCSKAYFHSNDSFESLDIDLLGRPNILLPGDDNNFALNSSDDAIGFHNANHFEVPPTNCYSNAPTNEDKENEPQMLNNNSWATCLNPSSPNVFFPNPPNFSSDYTFNCFPTTTENPYLEISNENDFLTILDDLISGTDPVGNGTETASSIAQVDPTFVQTKSFSDETLPVPKLVRTISYERKRSQNNKACVKLRRKRKIEQYQAEIKVIELSEENQQMKKQIKNLELEVQRTRALVIARIQENNKA